MTTTRKEINSYLQDVDIEHTKRHPEEHIKPYANINAAIEDIGARFCMSYNDVKTVLGEEYIDDILRGRLCGTVEETSIRLNRTWIDRYISIVSVGWLDGDPPPFTSIEEFVSAIAQRFDVTSKDVLSVLDDVTLDEIEEHICQQK